MTSHSTLTRRSPHSRRIIAISLASAVAVALVTGGSYALQAANAAQDRVTATAALSESTGRQHDQLGVYDSIATVHAKDAAAAALDRANAVLAAAKDKVDATTLSDVASSLASYEVLPIDEVESLTQRTAAISTSVAAAAAEADRVAAEQAAAAAAAAEAQRLQALAAANTPAGAKNVAQSLAASKYGWGDGQFSCLVQLWQKESGWSYTAHNPSGATGIPQALPGSKMASAGSDWATNAATQVAWGLGYIAGSYGTPCAAWAHSEAYNYY
ncbi:hypothetical protein [Cryobacterium breve]|uniref:aggregation-promoting factor C-terminal-like domain-containing protein n=1 Tax=Cryobacterium breve TaxID=1259258 RepID=UPI00248CCAA8|nr:hypothetical protein [Cryobacterium breve]